VHVCLCVYGCTRDIHVTLFATGCISEYETEHTVCMCVRMCICVSASMCSTREIHVVLLATRCIYEYDAEHMVCMFVSVYVCLCLYLCLCLCLCIYNSVPSTRLVRRGGGGEGWGAGLYV